MVQQILGAFIAVVVGVGGCVALFLGLQLAARPDLPVRAAMAADGGHATRRSPRAIRPWLFLGPALLSSASIWSTRSSRRSGSRFFDKVGENFVGFANYVWAFGDGEFRQSILNNLLWLVVVPAPAHLLRPGHRRPHRPHLVGQHRQVADLHADGDLVRRRQRHLEVRLRLPRRRLDADRPPQRHRPGPRRRSRRPGSPLPFWNNFFLMVILIWIQTGFAMVILSAALRGIPGGDASRRRVIDGANGFQIFFNIMIPQIWGTIAVVWTTITITVLKVFDIVLAMTNGQWKTQVLANLMFDWMFRGGGDFGRGATIAIIIMLAVMPIMIWNIRRANAEMGGH